MAVEKIAVHYICILLVLTFCQILEKVAGLKIFIVKSQSQKHIGQLI